MNGTVLFELLHFQLDAPFSVTHSAIKYEWKLIIIIIIFLSFKQTGASLVQNHNGIITSLPVQ